MKILFDNIQETLFFEVYSFGIKSNAWVKSDFV